MSIALLSPLCLAQPATASLSNAALRVTVAPDGAYEIRAAGLRGPVLRARIASEINHQWMESGMYPRRVIRTAAFHNALGHGRAVTVSFTGLTSEPDLRYTLRLYSDLPFGDIQAGVSNTTGKTVTVQAIRLVEGRGLREINLNGLPSLDRILSGSFSEDD
ncbi:MAG TPA: melibiase, partial [Terriglobia bacterium]|nr:melibiase [Terriglobia bacterium]